ncbi:MAG: bis(5'-nucleosyl)-tetraphosphatase [Planctomycetota bacterium]|jgi:8-oxo-dGTP pyrophosphatase MutT (NUDIX family)
MADLPNETAAGFILFHREGNSIRWLTLRNAAHATWGFPKGRCSGGESPLETARRELNEETGVRDINIIEGFEHEISYIAEYPDGGKSNKSVVYLLAEVRSDSITISSEHDEHRWVLDNEMLRLLQFENLRDSFSRAVAFLENAGKNSR